MAGIRSLESEDLASTKRIVAFGAIACAHSTSNAVSCPQPVFVPRVLAILWITKLATGKLYRVEKAVKSLTMLGVSYASIIAIVVPLPPVAGRL